MMEYPNSINHFWKWFDSVANVLFVNSTNSEIISSLDKRIQSLGPFDWEIGPESEKFMYLAISPNLNPELLEATRRIIKYAPKIENWIFYPSKPKKPYSPIWNMLNEVGKSIIINTSNWKFILHKLEDRSINLEIMIDWVNGNGETKFLAVEIATINILGEENFLTLIKNIYVTENSEFGGNLFQNLDQEIQKCLSN